VSLRWRAIFLACAPVAAFALASVLLASHPRPVSEPRAPMKQREPPMSESFRKLKDGLITFVPDDG
jgi:hypothetical protein